jgi:hypothetical protein
VHNEYINHAFYAYNPQRYPLANEVVGDEDA